MATTKKKNVTPTNQRTLIVISSVGLNPNMGSTLPAITPLVTLTTCVKGRIAIATTCILEGRDDEVNGKKVPAKKSIGVIKRKEG